MTKNPLVQRCFLVALICVFVRLQPSMTAGADQPTTPADRRPVDLVLSHDQRWLATANEGSDSVSLLQVDGGQVLDEQPCGGRPAAIVLAPDGKTLVVSCSYSGDLTVLQVDGERLNHQATIHVGFEPHGLAISADGRLVYVSLSSAAKVAVVDLQDRSVHATIDVGNWPRYLALTPDGSRLAVGCSGDGSIQVIDTDQQKVLYEEKLSGGINLGHLRCSPDGQYVYFPWMVYRTNPITISNIRRGWVLASRIARVRLDGPSYREAISLDVPRLAVADPHGIVVSRDQRRMVASAGGTHELLVYRLPDVPFVGVGGPGDLIDGRLLRDDDRFYRIDLGGRPLGMQLADDNRTLYVANYLTNSVQVVDIEDRRIRAQWQLGAEAEPTLARRGMAIFYDGRRSLDQWYSCHSCHQNGGANSRPMDTHNDGTENTFKTVLSLYHVTETKPWTWHGWQEDLSDAMHTSLTSTMLGRKPSDEDTRALVSYLDTLQLPPNPFRQPDGSLSNAARRGEQVFHGATAGCANCHSGPLLTDGGIHDVGLGSPSDRYEGFNTPSLRGTYRKVRWLHDGRSRSLHDLLTGPHAPSKVTQEGELSQEQLRDLIEYVKSL